MISRALIAILCVSSAACVGGRPIHYYAINQPDVAPAPARADGPVLLIGRISTPAALEDDRIRYRAGSNEVGAYEYHRWTERPAIIVENLLLETLRAHGKFRNVQQASSAAAGDYLLRGRLSDFDEVDAPGIQTRISLRLELLDHRTGMVVWDHRYNRDEPVDGKTMKDVVRSLEHNLQQVVTDAASGIETFLSNRSQGANQ